MNLKLIKLQFISYFLSAVLILLSTVLYSADTTMTFTLTLRFEGEDQPPSCFIPFRKLSRPKIGLALSGGGARGFAHIGVLKVLEKNNIPIDVIVGSSMGSIVGGLYAIGYSADEIETITKSVDWRHIMSDKPPRTNLFIGQKQERGKAILQIRFKNFKIDLPKAISPGQKLTSILTKLTLGADFQTNSDFDQLSIPFRAIACDLITGKKVLLKDGNLAEAMKSSSAVPLLFEPVVKDSMLLVDGGLVNNIPVDEVKEFNVDIVLVIDTTSKLNERRRLKVPWIIADQVTSIMQQEKNEEQRLKADVVIIPNLGNYKSDSFQFVDELIKAGEKEAEKHIDQIKKLIAQKRENYYPDKIYPLNKIEISGVDTSLKKIVNQVLALCLPNKTSLNQVYRSLESIYQTGCFYDVAAKCILNDSLLNINYHLTPNISFRYIKFNGNTVFSDSLLKLQIKSKFNQPINFHQAKNDLSQIIKLYKDKGYIFINIDKIQIINDTLQININEGVISSIAIEGNQRTKDFVILREIPLKKGDIFNINKFDNGINNIYSTNLFKTISLNVKNQNKKAKIKIKVEEKAFNVLRFSYHYDLERKNKAMIEFIEENFLGLANPLTIHTQYGARDQILQFKYRSDRIFKTYITNSLSIYYQRYKNFVYDNGNVSGEYSLQDKGFSFSIGRQIERLGVLSFIASVNEIRIKSISGYGYPTGTYDIKTIALQSIVDTQDQYPFPTKGKYYQFFYKISSATFFNSQTSFFKLFSSLEFYNSFLKRNTIHFKIIWGTSDLSTPFFEFFNLGGQSSFYGLNEREKIGRHIISTSLEYRYRFPFGAPINFYFSFRYDIGATWKNYVDISPKDFISGIGSALSASTPIGPVSAAFGKTSIGKNVFYFSVGFNF